jgi:hypothetical protein
MRFDSSTPMGLHDEVNICGLMCGLMCRFDVVKFY